MPFKFDTTLDEHEGMGYPFMTTLHTQGADFQSKTAVSEGHRKCSDTAVFYALTASMMK